MGRSTTKLNMAAMKKAAKGLKVKLVKGADPKAAAQTLREHFTETYEEDSLSVCGSCGWESTVEFTECPYCGTELGEPEEAPKKKEKKSNKTKAKGTMKPRGKKGKEKKPKKNKLAKADPKAIKECDERIDKIKSYRRNLAEEAYNIGVELKAIHDKGLWKAKGHKSFSAFCRKEVDYTRVMAYKYMSMAGGLKKEDAVKLGVSKSDLVINAPKKQQGKLLAMGKEGKSRADMEAYLRKATGKASTAAPPDKNRITLVGRVNEGDVFMPWIADKSGKETKRDTKGKHCPYEIVTGFTLMVREDEDGKGLIFTVQKVEEEEKAA